MMGRSAKRTGARRIWAALAVLLCALLAGCGGAGQSATPGSEAGQPYSGSSAGGPALDQDPGEEMGSILCRIVDGADEGELLLAAQQRGQEAGGDLLCRLAVGDSFVSLDGQPADPGQLQDGMLLEVVYSGNVLETYPAQLEGVVSLQAISSGQDDRCGLVLQVFEDLWTEDSGLNGDIQYLGFEISEALVPQPSERAGIAWRFAELHGAQPLTGSWQQLADEGYIDDENLYWEDGLFFSFTPTENAAQQEGQLFFTAQKWRSGLGALFFVDCTASKDADGAWQYEAGGFAIA